MPELACDHKNLNRQHQTSHCQKILAAKSEFAKIDFVKKSWLKQKTLTSTKFVTHTVPAHQKPAGHRAPSPLEAPVHIYIMSPQIIVQKTYRSLWDVVIRHTHGQGA